VLLEMTKSLQSARDERLNLVVPPSFAAFVGGLEEARAAQRDRRLELR